MRRVRRPQRVAALAAATLLCAVFQPIGRRPALAEVWPQSATALIRGPLDSLEPGALALWSNPALLAAGSGPRVGAAFLEPFGVSELARGDAALGLRSGSLAWGAGGSRFGRDEFAALAWAVGVAGAIGESPPSAVVARGEPFSDPPILWGIGVRRHERDRSAAWAVDLGARVTPSRQLAASIVARSALRAGELAVAPDPEWQVDVCWSREAAAIGLGIARDAVGPLAGSAALRATLGGVRLFTVLTRIAGGETRAGIGIEVQARGVSLAAGREVGPTLGESRAAAIAWGRPRAVSRSFMHTIGAAEIEPSPIDSARAMPESDSLLEDDRLDEWDRALERFASDAEEDRATGLAPEGTSESLSGPGDEDDVSDSILVDSGSVALGWEEDRETTPVRSGAPRGRGQMQLASRLTFGGDFARARGAAVSLSTAARLPLGRKVQATLRFSGTRDTGEPAVLDEARASLSLVKRGRAFLVAGAYDLAIGEGLAAAGTGSVPITPGAGTSLLRLAPAARRGRTPQASPWGVAALWRLPKGPELLAWWERTARDSREAGGGRWPSGGRFHASALERARRGTLEERARGLALAWREPGSRSELAIAWARASFAGAGPRLLPGGALLGHGDWLSISGRARAGSGMLVGEWALGPGGRTAQSLRARLTPRTGGRSARFEWARRAPGFAPVEASPASPPRGRVAVRCPLGGLSSWSQGWVETSAEERWSAPTASLPGRATWIHEALAGMRAQVEGASASLEVVATESWRGDFTGKPFGGGAGLDREPWRWRLRTRVRWLEPRSRCQFLLGHTLRLAGGVGREVWDASCQARLRGGGWWRLRAELRPGALGPSQGESGPAWETDLLGGVRFLPTASPARVTAWLRLPLAEPATADLFARCSSTSRNPRYELSCGLTWGSPRLMATDAR